jgi:hypothetical protein
MNFNSTLDKIKIQYKQYIDDPDCVYKQCRDRWIVIMKLLPDTRTNETRNNVRDAQYAKFRANKLKVLVIFSIKNPSKRMRAIINEYAMTQIKYKVNKIVRPDAFDNNLNVVCGNGVHYFKSIDAAFYWDWGARRFTSGQWCQWYENGQIVYKGDYQNRKKIGHWCKWYENGQIAREGDYQNGKEIGHWRSWHSNGQIVYEGDYQNDGKRTGHWRHWYSSGQMSEEGDYQDGERTGHWCYWCSSGQMSEEGDYQNGKRTGQWCIWYLDGQKMGRNN